VKIRPYNASIDSKAVHRIWYDIRWIDGEDDAKALDTFLTNARAIVAEIDGEAECLVVSVPGDVRHLQSDISMGAVTAVSTSLIARKQGLASKLTARLIAEDAVEGLETSALGMFDQGYYNRLGFGTGPYENYLQFDPCDLNIDQPMRPPVRFGKEDSEAVYQSLVQRWRSHGAIRLFSAEHVQAEMAWTEKPFGLGYRNKRGDLTHFIWGKAKGENGPFTIGALAYQSREQLLELLALIKGIGDQAVSVKLREPGHIQLQDFINTPQRRATSSRGSELGTSHRANAFWQLRINDLEKCLSNTHLPGRKSISFNLDLSDPITRYLESDQPWQGISGEYTVDLGEECRAVKGLKAGLPLVKATVPGMSRLWQGSASATAIALAGELQAEDSVLDSLEQTLSLPLPRMGWEF
jgi:predicted acetyltransferase